MFCLNKSYSSNCLGTSKIARTSTTGRLYQNLGSFGVLSLPNWPACGASKFYSFYLSWLQLNMNRPSRLLLEFKNSAYIRLHWKFEFAAQRPQKKTFTAKDGMELTFLTRGGLIHLLWLLSDNMQPNNATRLGDVRKQEQRYAWHVPNNQPTLTYLNNRI